MRRERGGPARNEDKTSLCQSRKSSKASLFVNDLLERLAANRKDFFLDFFFVDERRGDDSRLLST